MKSFLDALYSDLPPEAWFYIWTLAPDGSKYTHWMQDTSAAVDVATAASGTNVYYPVGFTNTKGSPSQRATLDEVAGIIGLVADIDFKDRACPDEKTALKVLATVPLKPTYIINSGHGLQAGWLFKEPWAFDTPDERQEAKQTALAWGYTVSTYYNKAGYELDPVHDITRVMRVPGTTNVKSEPYVPCTLLHMDDDQRYNPQDIDDVCVDVPRAAQLKTALPTVDISAAFPIEKHDALCANVQEYEETWKHERDDLGDDCSKFDLALASYTVRAGWTDNEITAMLNQHRRKYGQNNPAKLTRADYYARTIKKAREGNEDCEAKQRAADVLEDDAAPPEDVLASLGERWGIPLTAIRRITGDPAIYEFWVGGRSARIEATELTQQRRFQGEIFSVANVMPQAVGPKEKPTWRELMNKVAEIAEVVDGGDGATVDGSLIEIILEMASERRAAELHNEVDILGGMFYSENRLWFRLNDLAQKCKMVGMDGKLSPRALSQRLRALGGDHKQWQITDYNGKKQRKLLWGLPVTVLTTEN